MKARGAEKNFHEIIARNVEGGADSAPPPALLGLKEHNLSKSCCITFLKGVGHISNKSDHKADEMKGFQFRRPFPKLLQM